MKRRNADCSKLRRPLKRNRITEGIYSSTFLYLKFLVVWVLVLLADFVLEFRFEYLWPFWLFIRSVYDSFRYQGLAFSVFFVCVAFTSDIICLLFIPVQWLFFAASTYVWVQYVWHTERGVCLPTVSLWILFVYIEAAIRFKDLKNFHVDLCRPFAAHWLEQDVKRLKADLQANRQLESELRIQLSSLSSQDRSLRSELGQLRQDNELLQTKLHSAVQAKQKDKQTISQLEKRLKAEQEARALAEKQLAEERKRKKMEEATAARAVALAAATRVESTDSLRVRIRELETECKKLSMDMKLKEEQIRDLEGKCQELRKYKENEKDTEVLMSALSAMQEKTQHLENSLSAETRIKLDLFSALGDAKRQLEIAQGQIHHREQEIAELKQKIAEVMAVMPSLSYSSDGSNLSSVTPHYSSKFMDNSPSSLDPNASVYQPLKK
ncbi:macoilin-1 isoform X2 [Echeneis naucrates]|uniref:macoilin-1 isoform X2 n=1 Tax=Echeneis naucrates TaxID=173247 RepID=UPI001113E013|nr:macoilin-1-like isoform X2 [Echeneis naucrates]